MIPVYNFLQIILLITGLPILVPMVLVRRKYRGRTLKRLGFGMDKMPFHSGDGSGKVIWIHALSVGEVTSALPLVKGIRRDKPDAIIVFSAATRTGAHVAEKRIRPFVDRIIAAPFDLLFSIHRFIRQIRPDLFILIETDFWPNWLDQLRKNNIPIMLVNGRISKKSFRLYHCFSFFFRPVFRCFSLLSMQTRHDAEQMQRLGIAGQRIMTLGNLKYDTASNPQDEPVTHMTPSDLNIPENSMVWICGSTHRGEEEIILNAYKYLKAKTENLVLIIAPRDIARSGELMRLIREKGLQAMRRTSENNPRCRVLVLDTIGELTLCYQMARVAFIGGSLVPKGGHNPLEPAAYGVPVLFGPHMEDFQEIARDLENCGGGATVGSASELTEAVSRILLDELTYASMSGAAENLVQTNSGVIARHVQAINNLLLRPSA